MNNLSEIINKINTVNSEVSLNKLLSEISNMFNYHWAGFMVFTPLSASNLSITAFGNTPSRFINDIKQDSRMLSYCMNEDKPIDFNKLMEITESQPTITSDAAVELLIPIKGRGTEFACLIFSIPNNELSSDLIDKIGWYWLIPSTFIYSCYRKINSNRPTKITQREQECIKWASEGKTTWEISQILSISKSTVNFHLANCIEKTGSINRQQAIVKCLLDGQLLTI
ncbi:helix-turn-helix transcriptional regulator [Shewanella japonica]|uniref:helix-turn-helix transcriptional regulator n=1 Tax=Shewanella japonica TaxID=93973 RepID=UPI002493D8AD|nr:helix-turn-helix transcriptional regulator [Shewanella japonica]